MPESPDLPSLADARGALDDARLLARQRRVAFATVALPALAFAAGLALAVAGALPPFYFGLWAVMHALTAIGISVGFHRLAAHQSFRCGPATRRVLFVLGSMSAQGPVVHWATNHRRHHHASDGAGDAHSPHCAEDGRPFAGALAGWWHAHLGWLFRSHPANPGVYARDLLRDPDAIFVNRHYLKWVGLGLVLPGAAAAVVFQDATSFALGALVGGGMRICAMQHFTWCINSLTHLFGRRPYGTADRSANIAWLALPTAGEAWHNNHHAFPYSARLGLAWWELDPGWWTLVALRALGLAWELREPSADKMAAKRSVAAAS